MSAMMLILGVLLLGLVAFASLWLWNSIVFWRVMGEVFHRVLSRHNYEGRRGPTKKVSMVIGLVTLAFAAGCEHEFIDLGECLESADCADGDPCTVDVCDVDRTCIQIPSASPACDPCVPNQELCNSRDDDCDGEIDEGLLLPYYVDADGDGWGYEGFIAEYLCPDVMPGPGISGSGGDCDNFNVAVHPTAQELCDGLDNDCDGETDEDYREDLGRTCVIFSRETGLCTESGVVTCAPEGMYQLACNGLPVGTIWSVTLTIDMCDNGLDDDCDGTVDNGCP